MLRNHKDKPVEILVPSVLQMCWVLFLSFFCAASETARNVASLYTAEPVCVCVATTPTGGQNNASRGQRGVLAAVYGDHGGDQRASFLHLLEVYVDDFIQMAQTTNRAALCHLSRPLLHGVHSVFRLPDVTGHADQDPVLLEDTDGERGPV